MAKVAVQENALVLKRTIAAISLLALASLSARAGDDLDVVTGDLSGVYFPLGIALAKNLSDALPDRNVQVRVTKGSVANLKLLGQGQGEIALAAADAIEAAQRGDREAGFDKPLANLRSLGALYPDYVQIVATAKSGIRKLADLKGKRLSVGAPQSGSAFVSQQIFAAAGLDEKEIGTVKASSFSDAITEMKEDKIDATLQSAGLGVASLNELSNTLEIVMVPVPREVVKKIGASFTAATIPAATYHGQAEIVPTASVMNYLVTRADLPDAHVTKLAALVFDHLDELKLAHPAARAISLQGAAREGPLPLHDGARAYFGPKLKRAEADALNARGEERLAKGERVAALSDFTAALKLDPQHQAARDNAKKLARIVEREGAMMGLEGKPK